MTTITVEIDKKEDLSNLTEYINRLGLKYEVDDNEGLLYTDDVKNTLDERYDEYKNGIDLISQQESKQKIQELLAAKK
ncbi:hypothetical protein [Mucilaginibacter flavidus]|uniref:hypothetical protein n=1 Tax=Mucilaginibacter flavidus TaxID=2949309 RepID=UPI0020920704|nr:hypothetical protein [Mucilaginibacter flavidus]MCO5945565.1 hypothetical protein [Mucilaginibacter flavidus]